MNSGSASELQAWAGERGWNINAALVRGVFFVTIIGGHKTVVKTGSDLECTMLEAVEAWDSER